MKKKIDYKSLQNTNLNLQNIYFSDHIKTTNINILLNRVKIEKKNDFKKKIYFFSMLSLVIIFFSVVTISI
jgi:hypothetical protein|tara:strand:+ start:223 stop:435 length:213 start_codon:yes stop_codon:yes gene_type:complete